MVKLDARADRIEALAAALAAAEDKGAQLTTALEATATQHGARVAELVTIVAALQVRTSSIKIVQQVNSICAGERFTNCQARVRQILAVSSDYEHLGVQAPQHNCDAVPSPVDV